MAVVKVRKSSADGPARAASGSSFEVGNDRSDGVQKLVRHRSPNYPMFGLSTAIEKVRAFYDELKRNTVDIDTAMHAIGYRTHSAVGGRGISSLVGYGLLDELKTNTGTRQFKISPAAYRLFVILDSDQPEYKEVIQDFALRPRIYNEIVRRFPEPPLPNDRAIRSFLLDNLNFNPEYVADVIKDFRATYEFAQLDDRAVQSADDPTNDGDGTISTGDPPKGRAADRPNVGSIVDGRLSAVRSPLGAVRTLVIPLPNNREALLQIPDDLTEADYRFLEVYLRLMKDAISGSVSRDTERAAETEHGG